MRHKVLGFAGDTRGGISICTLVRVTVTIDREVCKLDERALSWGHEKTLATTTQRVGIASQAFTIEVAPR